MAGIPLRQSSIEGFSLLGGVCEAGQARSWRVEDATSSPMGQPTAMNYRHAFHAGGFADVIKHIVLVRMLTYLREKPAPFRVIDTHAGAGRYDLTGEEARRSGEWLTGIARVMQARFSENALPLVTPYLDIVRAFNAPGKLEAYPGSPLIARALLRPQDRLTACEIEPGARKQLSKSRAEHGVQRDKVLIHVRKELRDILTLLQRKT